VALVPNTLWSNAGIDALMSGELGTELSLHSASPGTTGANEINGGSYARAATTWASPSGSDMAGSQETLNVPASTTIAWFGVWTSGGTYHCGGQLSSPETFGAAGTYSLTPTISGSG
jgi:hypothetical protein